MFCSQCGKESGPKDKFCSVCGSSLSVEQHQKSSHLNSKVVPYFGRPLGRWLLRFECKNSFPTEHSWLSETNTLVTYQNHLALFRGDEKRSYALEVLSAMGLAGVLVAGVRSVKDKMNTNDQFNLDSDVLQKLHDENLMVWCTKDNAEIWRYQEKPWMFIKSSSEQIYCKFETSFQVINAVAKLWCTAEYGGHAKGDVDGFGCKAVKKAENISEKDVPAAMAANLNSLSD